MCEARTECMIMAGRRHTAVLPRAKKKGHTKPQTTLDAVWREISASSVLTAASIVAHIRQITACSDSRHGSRRARQRPGMKAAAACRGSDGRVSARRRERRGAHQTDHGGAPAAAHTRQTTACSDTTRAERAERAERARRVATYLQQPRAHDAAREAVGERGLRVVERQHRVPHEEAGRVH